MSSRPELKVEDEHGFIRYFNSLPAKDGETIRIFDRSDWYTAHGDDAAFIARTVYKTTSVLRQLGRSDVTGLPSVTMTVTVFRNFLREALFRLGKRVEIYESSGGRMHWKVAKVASPGNLQDVEEELGGHVDAAPIILAVRVTGRATEARQVGVCFADASVRELGVSQFLDNDAYSNLESLLIQLGVRECLVQLDKSGNDVDLSGVKSIIDQCGAAYTERPSGDYSTRDIEQDLARLLTDETAGSLQQTGLNLAMGSASALIKYLGLMQDQSNFGQYRLYQHDLSQFMKLDASALKALNLMPGPRDGAKSMSLFGLLNHCKTPIGTRLLSQWLKQPLMSLEAIEERQQLVEAFVNDTELRQTMQEQHLRSIPDLYRLSKKFQRKKAKLEDVVRAYQVALRLPGFIGTLEGVIDEQYQEPLDRAYTSKLKEHSTHLDTFQELVETTIDLEAMDNHEFIIKSDFDEGLRVIRSKLDKLKYEMEKEFKGVAKDLGQEVDKKLFLENHKSHGWCMRLTRAEAGCIRNKSKYQECSTQKNGVYFTTQTLQSMRRESDQLSENYNRTQSSLASEVVHIAASYCPVFEKLAGVLAHLDVVTSFAHCSVHAPTAYVRPRMHPRGTGDTVLREARHPCMEAQDDVRFITNDVALRRGASEFLVITGPNMGGKSTYIRQIGVIALMAQVGCFVPCAAAELCIFDCILARVGASDSQLKGVSTFMAEMLETAGILAAATRESLIIIDELGRGTSTYDGFGLAWAISEHVVREVGAFALFATHFHELTALADDFPQVENLHVVAHIGDGGSSDAPSSSPGDDDDNDDTAKKQQQRRRRRRREVTLLYKVERGVCDQSFGIHVAELVRFPPKVIGMAKRKADELEDFTTKHELNTAAGYGKADVEEGSALLREALLRWKAECDAAPAMTSEEKVESMRRLINADAKLVQNGFFQSITTL